MKRCRKIKYGLNALDVQRICFMVTLQVEASIMDTLPSIIEIF